MRPSHLLSKPVADLQRYRAHLLAVAAGGVVVVAAAVFALAANLTWAQVACRPLFALGTFIAVEAFGLFLLPAWFAETGKGTATSSPALFRLASITWQWYTFVFLIIWLLSGLVFPWLLFRHAF